MASKIIFNPRPVAGGMAVNEDAIDVSHMSDHDVEELYSILRSGQTRNGKRYQYFHAGKFHACSYDKTARMV